LPLPLPLFVVVSILSSRRISMVSMVPPDRQVFSAQAEVVSILSSLRITMVSTSASSGSAAAGTVGRRLDLVELADHDRLHVRVTSDQPLSRRAVLGLRVGAALRGGLDLVELANLDRLHRFTSLRGQNVDGSTSR
jgi:hypothetical protein